MVYKMLSLVIAILVVLTACATGPVAAPPAGTDQTKAQVEKPKPTAEQSKPAAEQAKPTAKPTAAGPSGTLVAASSNFGDDVLDPVLGTPANTPPGPMFEAVVAYDDNGKLIPRLAESWTLSPDGLVWTFKVQKGVKFHNGDEMTSADLKFSLERFLSPKSRSPWTPVWRNIVDRIDNPDPYTLVVNTKAVDTTFVAGLTGWLVMPKKYFEEKGEENFNKNPIATGPWKFVKHAPGSSVEYEAVQGHWRVTPAFQNLIVKLVPEESTRMAMLKRGEADIIEISLDAVDEIKSAGFDLRFGAYATQPRALLPGTWMNPGQPTNDIRVRQALSFAINREEMAKTFFKGLATPAARWATSTYSWAWDPSWKHDPYDPQKAKQLLADAGYPNKFSDPVITTYAVRQAGSGWLAQWMEIVSGYWEAVGVKTKITPIDNAALRSMTATRPPDPRVVGSAFSNTVVASYNTVGILWNGYGSTGIYALSSDPEWDVLYRKILTELDEGKRIQNFREAQNRGHDSYVDISTVDVKTVYAVGNKVGEWRSTAAGLAAAYEGVQHK